MSETQAPANMPRTRSQLGRRDPEPRPISGVPFGGIAIANKREDRVYCLVDKGAGGGKELICPETMLDLGWEIERWESVDAGQGYGGAQMYKALDGALRFVGGSRVGPPGSPIETRGHVLMSKDKDEWAAERAAGQASADPRERSIRTQALQASEARSEIKKAQVSEKYARVSQMTNDEVADLL